MESNDRLNLQNDKDIEKLIPFEIEPILFSEKIYKINRWSLKQERVLVLTVKSVYIFRKKQLRKKLCIGDLGCIVRSLHSNEFILHFPKFFDLRIQCERREDFLNLVKLRFAHIQPNYTLKVYGIPSNSLKEYHTTPSNKKYGIDNMPSDEMRMYDEEIKSAVEYERESMATAKSSSQPQAKDTGTPSKQHLSSQLTQSEEEFNFENPRGSKQTDTTTSSMASSNNSSFKSISNEQDEMRMSVLVASRKSMDVKLEDFKLITVLGRGTFGKVYLAELKLNGSLYAIKSIRKDVLLEFDQVNNTKLEKDILFSCDHPFLVGMDYLFQSQLRLYFVMPFVRGGELYKIFQNKKRFPEVVVKFYAAQIVMAIGYLHSQGIAHRDLKLENILIDGDGYIKIIDFGLAKIISQGELSMSFCGTPEYLAPEMVSHAGHDQSVDWWALGVLIYEMLIGVTPFYNRNRNMLLMKIKNSKVIFPDKTKYKIEYSDEIVDLIVNLLHKDKQKRLGFNGDGPEILAHPFFASLDLKQLEAKLIEAPFKPEISTENIDVKYFNAKNDAKDLTETYVPEAKIRKIEKFKDQFKDFDSKPSI